MRIVAIDQIRTLRSIVDLGPIELGDITLLVGANNTGKSSVLQSLLAMQQGTGIGGRHVRLGASQAEVHLTLEGIDEFEGWETRVARSRASLSITIDRGGSVDLSLDGPEGPRGVQQLVNSEPNHLIVPFLSRRRPEMYDENIRAETAMGVYQDMRFLSAKLLRVAQPAHPAYQFYGTASREILGVEVTAVPGANGYMPGVYVGNTASIALAEMGAGVAHIVGFLADLALADKKIFLIEEPENDLHPSALRALLDLIIHAADRNQFLISTHSNIVLRHLGSRPESRIYHVEADQRGAWPPVTTIEEVRPEPAARSEVLSSLGYELRDFEFFDGWLFLEESSAESLIRDYLIPWFVPELAGRLRTVSAKGANRVAPLFDDFNRLVLFTHLETRYRDRAWVLVDGDQTGEQVVERLRSTYSNWQADRFRSLAEENFERYYPNLFSGRVDTALQTEGSGRQQAKRELLTDVLAWVVQDPQLAKTEFEISAAEPIALLREIEAQLTAST